jgi:hypothetical protein
MVHKFIIAKGRLRLPLRAGKKGFALLDHIGDSL